MNTNNVIDATYEFTQHGLLPPFNRNTLSTLNQELGRPQCWVCWFVNGDGRKQPVWTMNRNGVRGLRYKDKTNFLTYEQAVELFDESQDTKRPATGVGLILRPGCGVVAFDGDAVIDPDSTFPHNLKQYFHTLLEDFSTFAELSVGGEGVHAVGLYKGGEDLNAAKSMGAGHNEARIINNGFITLSGNGLNGYSKVSDITATTKQLHQELSGGRVQGARKGDYIVFKPDSIKLAVGLTKQIDETNAGENKRTGGDYSGQVFAKYNGPVKEGQRSEQSMRLVNLLAFTCGRDTGVMRRLYEKSAFNKATGYADKNNGRAMLHDIEKAARDKEVVMEWGTDTALSDFADIIDRYRGEGGNRPLEELSFGGVEIEAIDWLWKGNFALGCLSIIAGEPGVSKSTLTAFFAAAVSNKVPFPDGAYAPQGDVCILSAEDHLSKTLAPRLKLAGVNMSKVYSLDLKEGQCLNLEDDIEGIERHIKKNRPDTKLLIIDPINAYINGDNVDTHRDTDIRKVLNPLGKMAERLGIAVVAVSHFSKSGSNNTAAINKVLGSIGYVAAARAVFGVVRDTRDTEEENQNLRLFLPIKNNLGPCGSGYSYEVKIKDVFPAVDVVHAVWSEEEVTDSINSIINPPRNRRTAPTRAEEAEDWIMNNFTAEWQDSGALEVGAHDAGIANTTYKRARMKLQDDGLVEQKKEAGGNVLWRLTGREDDPLET